MASRTILPRAIVPIIAGAVLLAVVARVRAQGPAFKSGVDMVALTITVTDAAGQFVSGLTARDFVVYEEGLEQPVALFGSAEVPIDVAFVLDTSASMDGDLPLVKQAARGLVGQLRDGDRVAVVDVKTSIAIPEGFTSDRDRIVAAVDRLHAAGSTAIYDGLYASLHEFERERRRATGTRRQALVLLSDGFDNTSHVTFDDVAELARRLDVTIYTIALRSGTPVPRFAARQQESVWRADYAVKSLARETGGLAFFPTKSSELDAIYSAIARELVSQYALGYVAPDAAAQGGFRRVSVRLLPPAQGSPRTRSGYFAREARCSHARTSGQSSIAAAGCPNRK